MMQLHRLRVFTRDAESGNGAVVVSGVDADSGTLQSIATELGEATTVFILPSSAAAARLRFFTTQAELPACGHGILAAAQVLLGEAEDELEVETQSGTVRLRRGGAGQVGFHARVSRPLTHDFGRREVLDILGLPESAVLPGLPFTVASVGSPKLLVPVADIKSLHALRPAYTRLATWSASYRINGAYVYTPQTIDPAADFHARGFNPLLGNPEDVATGVAAGALAAAMSMQGRDAGRPSRVCLDIEQGHLLGRPSRIQAIAAPPDEHESAAASPGRADGRIPSVWIGGDVVSSEPVELRPKDAVRDGLASPAQAWSA